MNTTIPVHVRPFTRAEFTCKGCGKELRVDFEFGGGPIAGLGHEYRHCPNDEPRKLGGPVAAVWEKLDGEWVIEGSRHTT